MAIDQYCADMTAARMTAHAPPRSEVARHLPLLLAGAISVGLGLAGMTVLLLGVFAGPVTRDLGWPLALFQMAGPLILPPMIVFGPFIGSLADRYGSHRVAVPSLVLFGLALGSLGLVTSAGWTWVAGWLAVGLTGCGTCGLAWAPAITARFEQQRGLALAIMLSGSSVVAIAGPSLARWLIDAFGWRMAYAALGAIPVFVAAPLVALLTKGQAAPRKPAPEHTDTTDTTGATLPEALRDGRFWLVAGALALVLLAAGGLVANLVPILVGRGHAPAAAAGMAGIIGVALILGNLATGFLVDRFAPQIVSAAVMALPALSMPLLLAGPGLAAMAGIALLGLASGAEFNLLAYLCGRLFGKRQFGRIYAIMIILPSLASSLGGPLLGFVHDRNGSFEPALGPVTLAILAGAGLLLFVRVPPRR